MTLGTTEEFSAQLTWPFLFHYNVVKGLHFYRSYMCELLPQTELEKRNLWQCLEIACLVSFEGGNLMSSREVSRS